jgi:hypothetical protein
MKNIVELYWIVDEVVKRVEQKIEKKMCRGRKNKLTKSELITMALIGHFDSIETDKKLYEYVINHLKDCFKNMPCYEQFTRGIRSVSKYLDLMLEILCQMNANTEKDFYIVDSTALPVGEYDTYGCPKWASDQAKIGKNIFGYYHGFKLHIIINRRMEVVSFMITTADVHDVKLLSNESFIGKIKGLLIGDKGYVCPQKLLQKLRQQGLDFIFKQRNNMDPFLNELFKKELSQRHVIEGVFSYLKNRLKALHSFARSAESFLVHVKTALAAFMLRNLKTFNGLTI